MRIASNCIEQKVERYALSFKKDRKYPAAVSGAEYLFFQELAKSGYDSTKLYMNLRLRLETIGKLYSRVNKNILGYCAEVNASNKLLNRVPYIRIKDIALSKTLRPRTMQIIPMCENCKLTFK